VTIKFGGLTLHSGLYLYADNNGIVVSEQSLL